MSRRHRLRNQARELGLRVVQPCKEAGCLHSITGDCTTCENKQVQLMPTTRMCMVCIMGSADEDVFEPFTAHSMKCARFGK